MIVYVVTNPELGWDCVVEVLTDKDLTYSKYSDKEVYVISRKIVNEKKEVNVKSKYKTIKYETSKENYLVADTCDISGGKFYAENSKASMNFIASEFEKFCKLNDLNAGVISLSKFEDGKKWFVTCDGITDKDNENCEIDNKFYDYCVENNIEIA